jgi:uncharacterized repeat protein (TIGR01451 family)
LSIRAPKEVLPGKEVEYHLFVENCSKAPAHHVGVVDRMPPGATYVRATPAPPKDSVGRDVRWDLGTLPPYEKKEIVLVIKPPPDTDFENQAFVTFEHGQKVRTHQSQPDVRLRVHAPPRAGIHETITYYLEVSNLGKAEARDVTVRLDGAAAEMPILDVKVDGKAPAGGNLDVPLQVPLASLPPGQKRRIEITRACSKTGVVQSQAEVIAAGGARQQAMVRIEVVVPRLALQVLGPRWHPIAMPATYTIVIHNPGPVDANGVTVTDTLPPEVMVRSAPQGSIKDRMVSWHLDKVRAGGKQSLELVVRVDRDGKFRNVVRVLPLDGSEETSSTMTQFIDASRPAVNVEPGTLKVDVGRSTPCRITVYNPTRAVMTSVVLSLTLPEGVRVEAIRGPVPHQQDGAILHFQPLSQLAPGQEAVYTLTAWCEKEGRAQLQADVTTGSPGSSGRWQEVLEVISPAGQTTGSPKAP